MHEVPHTEAKEENVMPDVRTMYDKEFLYSFDLQGRDVTVEIVRVKGGELTGEGGKKSKKPVVYFKGKEKGLALNITNARIIASLYGSFKSEDWLGKRVTLYPTTTTFGKETVDCIRIRPTKPNGNKTAQPDPEPPADEPDESEPGSDDGEGESE